jgi:hypothetical protein
MTARARRQLTVATVVLAWLLLVVACRTPAVDPGPGINPTPTAIATQPASPPASPEPGPTAQPTQPTQPAQPTPPPTASPSPGPAETPLDPATVAAWAQEICRVNDDLVAGTQQIIIEVPDPAEPSLAALQAVTEQRRPLVDELLHETEAQLQAVPGLEPGRPFQNAVAAELTDRRGAAADFFEAVAAATSLADYDEAVFDQAAAAQTATFRSARTIPELPRPLIDAIAVQPSCRFFELDARAVPRGLPRPDFPVEVGTGDLTDTAEWRLPAVDDGELSISDGRITAAFEGPAERVLISPSGIAQVEGDVRVESVMAMDGLAFSGVFCRASDAGGYAAQVTSTGLLLLLRRDGDEQTTLGRRVLADGAGTLSLDLALECVGGSDDEPLVLAAYLDGVRLIELTDTAPINEGGGMAGLVAHTLGVAPAMTLFESLHIRVPAD